MEITERSTRQSGELQSLVEKRLSEGFLQSQERAARELTQSRLEMREGLTQTTTALEGRFQSLEKQVSERLQKIGENVEAKLNENLKEGFKHFEKVLQHLTQAEVKLAELSLVGGSISDLNNLLKLPHLRGGFGETTLERLLADFLPADGFELQYQLGESTERVDAVVKLANQVLPIDSKFPREQVLPLFETHDPALMEDARRALAEFVKTQARSIAKKYIRPDHGTTDMALLFLPSETLYFEVLRNGRVYEEISKLRVYPISPNTLSMGLRSIMMAQEYYNMARGVEETIEDVRKARSHFGHFEKKFDDLGKSLRKAQESFETAQTHLGRYGSSVFRLVGEDAERLTGDGPPTQLEAPQ